MAINMLHTRSGARVLYLTTQGFEDVLFIQRINRRFHYDLDWVKPAPFAERRDCLGVRERISKDGDVLIPLDDARIGLGCAPSSRSALRRGPQTTGRRLSPSICCSPTSTRSTSRNWRRACSASSRTYRYRCRTPLRRSGGSTSAAVRRSPMRTSSRTWRPLPAVWSRGLRERGLAAPWALMKSNGGTMLPAAAPQQAVQLLLSGLAGGIIAGRYFGELAGTAGQNGTAGASKVITFDMGGTSTDVGLVIDGEYGYTTEYQVEWGIPVAAPFIDITTIGAGGGSLAWVDKGGFLKVGPQSAGADPGPACYDAGGDRGDRDRCKPGVGAAQSRLLPGRHDGTAPGAGERGRRRAWAGGWTST